MDRNFCRNHFIPHDLGDTSNFKFYHFCQKFEKFKMAATFGNRKHFWELSRASCIYSWTKNFAEMALSLTVKEIQAILSFTIFVKNLKAGIFGKRNNFWELGRQFWKEETFLRTEQSILHIYPMGQKFRRNCSISHGLGDTSNFKFYHFCQKFENSKWPPLLEKGKIFENWAEHLAYISYGPKISPKSLYLTWFRRYKQF